MKKIIWTIVVILLLEVAGALAVILSGVYNVAATSPHFKVVRWVLSTTSDRSVEAHAAGIRVPQFTEDMVKTGAHHYAEMCVVCHGGPGVMASEIGQGLNPAPPVLTDSAREMSDQEMFWIVKNGIKMTGMPAFGPTHSDEKIWDIISFVRKFPSMTDQEFKDYTQKEEKAPTVNVAPEAQQTPSTPSDESQSSSSSGNGE